MILTGVYRNDGLIALFPTRAQAEKYVMPTTWREVDNLISMAIDTGLRYRIKDVDATINPRARKKT